MIENTSISQNNFPIGSIPNFPMGNSECIYPRNTIITACSLGNSLDCELRDEASYLIRRKDLRSIIQRSKNMNNIHTLLESPTVFSHGKIILDVLVLVYILARFLSGQPRIRYLVKTSLYRQSMLQSTTNSVLSMGKASSTIDLIINTIFFF